MQLLSEQLEKLVDDGRVGTAHMCLYMALCQIRERNEYAGRFRIRRDEVMRLAKIQGRTTYYQCMRELNAWGYVEYVAVRGKEGGGWVRVVLDH